MLFSLRVRAGTALSVAALFVLFAAPVRAALVSPDFKIGPDVTLDSLSLAAGTQNYLVVWRDLTNGPNTAGISGSIVSGTGVASQAFAISDALGVPQIGIVQRTRVAFDGANFLVVWHDRRLVNPGVRGRFVSPQGTLIGTDFLIGATSPSVDSVDAQVVFSGTKYLVAWQVNAASAAQISYARVTTGGTATPPGTIPATPGHAVSQKLELLVAGAIGTDEALIAYQDIGATPAATFGARIASNNSIVNVPNGSQMFTNDSSPTGAGVPVGGAFLPVSQQYMLLASVGAQTDCAVTRAWLSTAATPLFSIAAAPIGATEIGTTVTITTTAPHGFSAGQQIVIFGVAESGYNGTVTLTSVPTDSTFTFETVADLPASGGGSVRPPDSGVSLSTAPLAVVPQGRTGLEEDNYPRAVFNGSNEFLFPRNSKVSDVSYHIFFKRVTTAGVDRDPYLQQVDSVDSGTVGGMNGATAAALPSVAIAAYPNGATEKQKTAIITTTVPHGLNVGDQVVISGVEQVGYNQTVTVTAVSATKFSYTSSLGGLKISGGGSVSTSTSGNKYLVVWMDGRRRVADPPFQTNVVGALIDGSQLGNELKPLIRIGPGAAPRVGLAPLTVGFGQAFSGGQIDSAGWNFGDGTSDTKSGTTHQYTVPGTYTAVYSILKTGLYYNSPLQIYVQGDGLGAAGGPAQSVGGVVGPTSAGISTQYDADSFTATLNFAPNVTSGDSLRFSGLFNPTFLPIYVTGRTVTIKIGTKTYVATLLADSTYFTTVKPFIQFQLNAATGFFTLTVTSESLFASLAGTGVANETVTKKDVQIPISVSYAGLSTNQILSAKYTATQDKSGKINYTLASSGAPGEGFLRILNGSANERLTTPKPGIKLHDFIVTGNMTLPSSGTPPASTPITPATAGFWKVTFGNYTELVPINLIVPKGAIYTYKPAKIKDGIITLLTYSQKTGVFYVVLKGLVGEGEYASGMALSTSTYTRADMAVSLDFDLAGGKKFQAGALLRLARADAAKKKWSLR